MVWSGLVRCGKVRSGMVRFGRHGYNFNLKEVL